MNNKTYDRDRLGSVGSQRDFWQVDNMFKSALYKGL